MSDPTDFETLQKLQFILNKEIQPVLAPREQIVEAINRHYGQTETESVDSMIAEFTDTQIDFTETEAAKQLAGGEEDNDAPVIKLVNLIMPEAITTRCSDIHIEPFADRVRIRYRIDGVLVERDSPPRRLLAPMISRIKIMGRIDISEKRRPQDGRIKTTIKGKHYDLRVSVLPTVHGQSVVMRMLDRANIQVSIKDLGFAEEEYTQVPADHQTAQRHLPGDGTDRLGQDHDAVRRPERAEPAGSQDHHGGGSGRILPAGHQPGAR